MKQQQQLIRFDSFHQAEANDKHSERARAPSWPIIITDQTTHKQNRNLKLNTPNPFVKTTFKKNENPWKKENTFHLIVCN